MGCVGCVGVRVVVGTFAVVRGRASRNTHELAYYF